MAKCKVQVPDLRLGFGKGVRSTQGEISPSVSASLDHEVNVAGRGVEMDGHIIEGQKIPMVSPQEEFPVIHLDYEPGPDQLQIAEHGPDILFCFLQGRGLGCLVGFRGRHGLSQRGYLQNPAHPG